MHTQKIKILKMELLTATVKLRKATYDDLAIWDEGAKITLSNQQFFVRMPNDHLESYTLQQWSDKHELKALIDKSRVWVFCGTSLEHDTDGLVRLPVTEVKAA